MSNIRTLYLGLDITCSKCVLVELMYRFHLKDSPAIYFLMKYTFHDSKNSVEQFISMISTYISIHTLIWGGGRGGAGETGPPGNWCWGQVPSEKH